MADGSKPSFWHRSSNGARRASYSAHGEQWHMHIKKLVSRPSCTLYLPLQDAQHTSKQNVAPLILYNRLSSTRTSRMALRFEKIYVTIRGMNVYKFVGSWFSRELATCHIGLSVFIHSYACMDYTMPVLTTHKGTFVHTHTHKHIHSCIHPSAQTRAIRTQISTCYTVSIAISA